MQKDIGLNPKLCVINIAEETFQGSPLRFLQNTLHRGAWSQDAGAGVSVLDCMLAWLPQALSAPL